MGFILHRRHADDSVFIRIPPKLADGFVLHVPETMNFVWLWIREFLEAFFQTETGLLDQLLSECFTV